MVSFLHNLSVLIALFLIILSYGKQTYQFEAYTSSQIWFAPATEDTVYFRLCNNNICGKFTNVAQGWPLQGKLYSYDYITNRDIGSITKAQIVLDGSDQLCLGHIKVDNKEYDAGLIPICIVDETGGCDTITVNLQNNNWQTHHTIPCEFGSILHHTYKPTKYPTINPTLSPTISPTKSTQIPSPSPIATTSPTPLPSYNPTPAPFRSANVDDIIKSTDINNNGSDSVERYDNSDVDISDKFAVLFFGVIFAVLFFCILVSFVTHCYFNKNASNIPQSAPKEGVASYNNIGAQCQSSQISEISSVININAEFERNGNKLNGDDDVMMPMILAMLSDEDIEDIYDKGVDDVVNPDSVTTGDTQTGGCLV